MPYSFLCMSAAYPCALSSVLPSDHSVKTGGTPLSYSPPPQSYAGPGRKSTPPAVPRRALLSGGHTKRRSPQPPREAVKIVLLKADFPVISDKIHLIRPNKFPPSLKHLEAKPPVSILFAPKSSPSVRRQNAANGRAAVLAVRHILPPPLCRFSS